ncbi:MAG TPA: DUF3800 domain-containing protein [Candidatus Acidoferrum sp.]|nr:DUF3800 domain-containing protein [Candidatus Acidoferrum sp.]
MKKKHNRVGLVEAYSDESGHSGSNLFDPNQPWFMTGTLLARAGVHEAGEPVVRDLCARIGVDELHATALGPQKIEIIAPELQRFLESVEARFLFTHLEKAHVACTKLVDAVLDSGTNGAVSTMHYGFRGFRLPLAHIITECMTPRDQKDFWETYRTRDSEKFAEVVRRIDAKFRAHATDPRLKVILGDAFAWAITHPAEVLDFKRDEGDAPNMIAFSLLIDGIHTALRDTGLCLKRFVHDEQEQFGLFMQQWYGVLRHWDQPTMGPMTLISDLRRVNVIRCGIELASSKETPGLQIVDIALWLYKRSIRSVLRDFPRCSNLVEFIADRAVVNEFSRRQLRDDAAQMIAEIAALPVSNADARSARQFTGEMEHARLKRMGIDIRQS